MITTEQRESIRLGFGADVDGEYQPLCRVCRHPITHSDCEWTGHTTGLAYAHRACRLGNARQRAQATERTFFRGEGLGSGGRVTAMGENAAWVIAERSGAGCGNVAWSPMRGRRYRTQAKVEAAYLELEKNWQARCDAGRMHPSWRDKFRQERIIVGLNSGESFADALMRQLGAGNVAWTLGGALA